MKFVLIIPLVEQLGLYSNGCVDSLLLLTKIINACVHVLKGNITLALIYAYLIMVEATGLVHLKYKLQTTKTKTKWQRFTLRPLFTL